MAGTFQDLLINFEKVKLHDICMLSEYTQAQARFSGRNDKAPGRH